MTKSPTSAGLENGVATLPGARLTGSTSRDTTVGRSRARTRSPGSYDSASNRPTGTVLIRENDLAQEGNRCSNKLLSKSARRS